MCIWFPIYMRLANKDLPYESIHMIFHQGTILRYNLALVFAPSGLAPSPRACRWKQPM